MTCYEELKARGLIAQLTNEEEISTMINEGRLPSISALTPQQILCMLVILWRCA